MQRDVVERAMAGDHAAFSEVRAQDATQEALVAAWRDIASLRDPDRFEAWLHRLLVRECYREARRGRRRTLIEGSVRLIPAPGNDLGHEHAVRDQLERGFRHLDVEQRTALVLHHYLGYSFPEIADVLRIPIGTAKSRVYRGTVAMRAALSADTDTSRLPEGRPA